MRSLARRSIRLRVFSTCLLMVVGSSVGVDSLSPASAAGPVFLEARATCFPYESILEPWAPAVSRSGTSWVCRTNKFSNAATGGFAPPRGDWGIAYAYNCGKRASEFIVAVGDPGFDVLLPRTYAWEHKRQGSGFYMETKWRMAALKSVPLLYRTQVELYIATPCTFHIRAVLGGAAVVSHYVPPLPAFHKLR